MKLLFLVWTSLFGTVFAAEQNSHDEAVQWLERMNQAVLSVNYEGHFVYQCGKSLEAMYIRHENGEHGPRESLSSLTGLPREVIRDANSITVITNRNGKLQVSQQPAVGKLTPLKSLQLAELEQNYELRMGGTTRVAGRVGVIILLLPRDELRYGYRLILDKMSALPLELTVIDSRNVMQSRIMFTDLRITDVDVASLQGEDEKIPDEASMAEAEITLAGLESHVAAPDVAAQSLEGTGDAGTAWLFEALPKGFRLINHQRSATSELHHFVFSDGLATVSLYLEPIREGDTAFEGFTTLGSMKVLGRRFDQYQLTVVGEVPARTLELLANSIRSRTS
ncbi:MucB/RseB C-terminal domain-containing protein [Thiolapillus sp.]